MDQLVLVDKSNIDFGNMLKFNYISVVGEQSSPTILVLDVDDKYVHGLKFSDESPLGRVVKTRLNSYPELLLDKEKLIDYLNANHKNFIEKNYRKYVIENMSRPMYDFSIVSRPYALTIRNYYTRSEPKNQHVELVDVNNLWDSKEYDRDLNNASGVEFINSIINEGIKDTGILIYQLSNNVAYIGEGNHRLKAAIKLGIRHIPMRVYIYKTSETHDGVRTGKKILTKYRNNAYRIDEDYGDKWSRSEMKPSELGYRIYKEN